MNVKAVLPTRGLIYAKTIRGILNNIDARDLIIIDSLPIPDCFNTGVRAALDAGAEYIWMVEEDNELPSGVLEKLVSLDADIATLDYPVGKGVSHIYERDGEILWCGIGCTLIKRGVFEAIQEPWFEVTKHLNFKDEGFEIVEVPQAVVGKRWGGHDSYFFYCKTRPLGFKIKKIEGMVGQHFRTKEIPKRELNNGHYTIYSL